MDREGHDGSTRADDAAGEGAGSGAADASRPPLAALKGASPPLPRWFADALAVGPECSWPVVRGAYSVQTMADEAMAAAQAGGLLDDAAQPPLVVGHSFGGFVALHCAQQHGARLAGVFALDTPLMSREQRQARARPGLRQAIAQRPTKLYPSLAAALARFRFAPEQPCDNLYIADHIARTSLKPVASPDGGAAWTWRFDPKVAPVGPGDAALALREAACPVAIGWGAESALVTPAVARYMGELAGPAAPRIEIPAARHHVMVDQPLALVSALRALLQTWPARK